MQRQKDKKRMGEEEKELHELRRNFERNKSYANKREKCNNSRYSRGRNMCKQTK